jgi:hypothetical protein
MSEIPFVKQLGDAIEQAAAMRIATRRNRIRRRIVVGAVGFAVAASGVAAASGVFSSAEQLASTAVGCYERASLDSNVAVLSTGEESPVDTCTRVLHTSAPLTACMADGSVAVFPGGAAVCDRLGLAPLPAGYAPARAKVNALARDVSALETSADCISPQVLAQRVQGLLDRTPDWAGWRTTLRLDVEDGPCGSVTGMGGDGSRSIEGSLDADGRHVMVFGGAARSTTDLLYVGDDALAPAIEHASGERCYTTAGLEAMARQRVARTGRAVSFRTSRMNGEPIDARAQRMQEGCAIVFDVRPAADGLGIVVEIDE